MVACTAQRRSATRGRGITAATARMQAWRGGREGPLPRTPCPRPIGSGLTGLANVSCEWQTEQRGVVIQWYMHIFVSTARPPRPPPSQTPAGSATDSSSREEGKRLCDSTPRFLTRISKSTWGRGLKHSKRLDQPPLPNPLRSLGKARTALFIALFIGLFSADWPRTRTGSGMTWPKNWLADWAVRPSPESPPLVAVDRSSRHQLTAQIVYQ